MRKAQPPEIIESEQFRSDLTELAHDFPMMDALLNAIRVRLSSDPDHGYQIQEDPDTFLHRITGGWAERRPSVTCGGAAMRAGAIVFT